MKQNSALVAGLCRLLCRNFSLLSILIGSSLFTFVAGPYFNSDSNLEFQAATNVIKTGMPFMQTGYLINQPPLGFYLDSVYFRLVGLSFSNGAAFITLFGLGSVLLVYLIGKEWYGKTTGLFAAAIFALTPWQLVFSRTFLIDAQCLFFSLLFLLIGVYAVKQDSIKLFMASSIVFSLAFATKLYAVFMLVPLAIFYFRYRQKSLRRPYLVFAFFVPLLIFVFAWYQFICQGSVINLFLHDDFTHFNPPSAMPSAFFAANYLWITLGGFILAATAFSLAVSLGQKQLFKNVLPLDLICLATIVAVAGVDTFMGVALNYQAPFAGAVKYNYQLLPFICLLAASIISKFQTLFGTIKKKLTPSLLFFAVAAVGVALFLLAFFEDFQNVSLYSELDYFVFWVQRFTAGYSFRSSTPITTLSVSAYVQYLGFALVLSGLIWEVLNGKPLNEAVRIIRVRFG